MSTWGEIRSDIFVMLDSYSGLTTASDLRNSVDRKLLDFRDWLYRKRAPRSVKRYTSSATVVATTTYIDILGAGSGVNPGLSLSTNYLRHTTLTVEDEEWEFADWETWVALKNSIGGDQRLKQSWTLDYQNYIYLRDYPTGSETWDAVLHYLRYPGAIDFNDSPETGRGFDDLYVKGVIRQFPNLFEGEERLALYGTINNQFEDLLRDYLQETEGVRKQKRLRPSVRRRRGDSVFWGTGETS